MMRVVLDVLAQGRRPNADTGADFGGIRGKGAGIAAGGDGEEPCQSGAEYLPGGAGNFRRWGWVSGLENAKPPVMVRTAMVT